MTKKPLNISEEAAVQMPMKTVASLILLVAAGVFAYTELTARLVSLETSRELFDRLPVPEFTPSKLKLSMFDDVVPAFGNMFVDVAVSFSALAPSIINVAIKKAYSHFILI